MGNRQHLQGECVLEYQDAQVIYCADLWNTTRAWGTVNRGWEKKGKAGSGRRKPERGGGGRKRTTTWILLTAIIIMDRMNVICGGVRSGEYVQHGPAAFIQEARKISFSIMLQRLLSTFLAAAQAMTQHLKYNPHWERCGRPHERLYFEKFFVWLLLPPFLMCFPTLGYPRCLLLDRSRLLTERCKCVRRCASGMRAPQKNRSTEKVQIDRVHARRLERSYAPYKIAQP